MKTRQKHKNTADPPPQDEKQEAHKKRGGGQDKKTRTKTKGNEHQKNKKSKKNTRQKTENTKKRTYREGQIGEPPDRTQNRNKSKKGMNKQRTHNGRPAHTQPD